MGVGRISDQISLKKTANWTSTPSGSLYLHRTLNLSYDPAVRQGHVSMFPNLFNHGISCWFYALFCFRRLTELISWDTGIQQDLN